MRLLIKKGFIYFLILLLVISMVNGLQISSKYSVLELCPRETGLFLDVLKNNEDVVRSYNVVLDGSASSWATVAPGSFILAPGEEETVYTYVTPSQSTQKGSYELRLELVSGEEKKSVKHIVSVKNCFGAGLSADYLEQSGCPGDALVYNLKLTNLGEFEDTFNLQVENGVSDVVKLSENVINLGKYGSKDVKVFVTAPKDSNEYKFKITATSQTNKAEKSLGLLLNVNPCYSFNLNVKGGNSYSVCDRSVLTVPMTVDNKGTVSNKFIIELEEAPVWSRLNTKELTVGVSESRTFLLALAPGFGSMGDYKVKVNVYPEKGDLKATANLDVEVRKCHSVSLNIPVDQDVVCKGVSSKYDIEILNDGEVSKNYGIDLDAPSWVNLVTENSINLKPNESSKLVLNVNPTEDVDVNQYPVNVKAVASDESSASAQDSIILDVKDLDECFKSDLDTDYGNVVVYYDSGLLVPLTLINNGLKSATYTLALSGDASSFASLPKKEFSLDPGFNDTFYLYVAPNIKTSLGDYYVDAELYAGDNLFLKTKRVGIEVTDQADKATVIGGENVAQNVQPTESWAALKYYWRLSRYYLLGLAVVIALLVLLFKTKAGKAVVDFFDESEEEPKKKKKR